jgi:hypothetical protein
MVAARQAQQEPGRVDAALGGEADQAAGALTSASAVTTSIG